MSRSTIKRWIETRNFPTTSSGLGLLIAIYGPPLPNYRGVHLKWEGSVRASGGYTEAVRIKQRLSQVPHLVGNYHVWLKIKNFNDTISVLLVRDNITRTTFDRLFPKIAWSTHRYGN